MSTLKHAITLARNGHSDDACVILRRLVTQNKNDIYAWLWLAEYSSNTDEACDAAYHVLALRPTNQRARKLLEQMGQVPIPPQKLQIQNQNGKAKRSLAPPQLLENRWNIGLLILFVLAAGIFLAWGIIASSYDNNQEDEDAPLEKILAPLQQNASENVASDDSQTQQVVEVVGGAALEHSVKILTHSIQLDFIFDVLSVVDSTAELDLDDRLSVTAGGQSIESPAYKDIIGAVYDGGEWIYEQVRNVVTIPFR